MAQNIDIRYQEKAKSEPINKRFADITGPSVLQGYRLQKGNSDFTVSLLRGGFNNSIAITPSGAKVTETVDLIDKVTIIANGLAGGLPRVDSIFLRYQFGTNEAVADYIVIPGSNTPVSNPNVQTHLLLGYVYVYPNDAPLKAGDFVSIPYGFNNLEIAGKSLFHGEAEFDKKVTFRGAVEFLGGGGTSGESNDTFIERLASPIVATEGQVEFTLPSSYTMFTQTLYVYKNGKLMPPSEWRETTNLKFSFYDPLVAGDEVWAMWYRGISIYTPAEHDHDDLYYRKYEIASRSIRYATDFFAGSSGRTVSHYLGNKNYVVVSVIPIEKSNSVGEITVEKRENEIIVYNSGSYRGQFDLTYMVKAPWDVDAGKNLQYGDFNSEATNFDTTSNLYKTITYRRKNGTIHMISNLINPNLAGKFTRVKTEYYNSDGVQILETKTWALTYDSNGNIIGKFLTA